VRSVPKIVFCRGSSIFYERLAELKPSAIGLDWQCDIAAVRKKVPQKIALKGNLDPDILLADVSIVEREVGWLLDTMKGDQSFIFNLGHGILPTTPEGNVHALVASVRSYV